jgi:hypothetical protein
MSKKAAKKPRKPRLRPFNVHFYLEGGISVWMQEQAETRAVLEQRTQRLLEGPDAWVRLCVYSGTMHLRREKVVAFHVEDCKAELNPEPMDAEDRLHFAEIMTHLDTRDVFLEKKS